MRRTHAGVMARLRTRWPWVGGIALAALFGCYVFVPTTAKALLTLAVSALPVLAIGVGLRRYRPRNRVPWLILIVAQACWFFGEVFWQAEILKTGSAPGTTAVANVFFLAFYPLLSAGLILLLRRRERDGAALIDAAVLATGIFVVTWVTLLSTYAGDTTLPALGRGIQIAYAIGDIVVFALALRLLLTARRRSHSFLLLIGSTFSLATSDIIWNWSTQVGNYLPGSWADLGWLGFSVLTGVAALHPSMSAVFEQTEKLPGSFRWSRLALLAAAALLGPLTYLAPFGSSARGAVVVTTFGTGLIALLVLARMGLILREETSLADLLAGQNEQLLELDRVKDELVASVSHELRTPLTSIRGYLELVRDGEVGELNDEQDEFLGIVERNSERLLHVISDLLDVAQLHAGRLALDLTGCDVAALARDGVARATPVASERGIELAFHGSDPEAVQGDADRLGQVIDNLLSNALKFTPPGGRVDVRTRRDNGCAVLEVADTGMGISTADQEQLFQRFFRTSRASAGAIQGTGLGLSIAKAIVESHGGTVSVQSEEGHGTTFRIELPALGPSVEAPKLAAETA
jgi:signal transduction histidine kinase